MGKSNEVISSFDSIYEEFSKTRALPWKEFNLFLPYLKKANSVLDLGCGNGRLIDFLRKSDYHGAYTGVDISENLIAHCKKTYPGETFHVSHMAFLPFRSESFDVVIASASIHHLQTKKEREKLTEEVHRLLKPDGVFTGIVWNMHQPRFFRYWLDLHQGFRNMYIPWKSKSGTPSLRYYFAFNRHILKSLLRPYFRDIHTMYVSGTHKKPVFSARNIFFSAKKIDH